MRRWPRLARMTQPDEHRRPSSLTGRITAGPDEVLRREILRPQFEFELRTMLDEYVWLEKVLLLEYQRMGWMAAGDVAAVSGVLDTVTSAGLAGGAETSMTDMAFTLEQYVLVRLAEVPPAWHVDRSRNDLQAAAHMLYVRRELARFVGALSALGRAAHRLASTDEATQVMPGYTHLQAAQVMTPGFYFAALVEQVLHTLDRLEAVHRTVNASPLGAGAMTGQELPWDRGAMAALLGCEQVRRHALVAVATRDWVLELSAEVSMLAVPLSRFVTDLMTWAGAGFGFVELPDAWSGISSAMPQKKNYPVLERIRGRTAHMMSGHVDVLLSQRNTPYSNTVEVSKEGTSQVEPMLTAAVSTLELLTGVLDRLVLRTDRMREACAAEYLGGFTLANLLTIEDRIPWRTAQVVAGGYVAAAVQRGLRPDAPDPALLAEIAAGHGHTVSEPARLLGVAFDLGNGLAVKKSEGSVHPDALRAQLVAQAAELDGAEHRWIQRHGRTSAARAEVERRLAELAGAARRPGDG